MKRLFFIFFVLFPLCWSCDKEGEVLSGQREKIASYLKSTHSPRLLSEQDRIDQQDDTSPYYTTMGETTYRYIRHMDDPERISRSEVSYGNRVTLTFRMYVFNYTNIAFYPSTPEAEITMPFYSNDSKLEESLLAAGLTPGAWKFEPLEVDLGRTEIIKGLEYALPGCRERDTVEVYMTYNMAYGKGAFGVVPKQSPVAMIFTVDKVMQN